MREIEIKFQITDDRFHESPDFTAFVCEQMIASTSESESNNTYFDTPSQRLQKLGMALRIRQSQDVVEQTIKCGDSDLGGLHSRAEFNAPIEGSLPTLKSFPDDIWPSTQERDSIQSEILPVFSVNYHRSKWLISYHDSQIELVLDRGLVSCGDKSIKINEIEIELKDGYMSDLFSFARDMAKLNHIRLGSGSKAKRGYQLAGLEPMPGYRSEPKHHGKSHTSREERILGWLLHMLHHEDVYFDGPSDDRLNAAIQMLRSWRMITKTAWLLEEQPDWLDRCDRFDSEIAHIQNTFSATSAKAINSLFSRDALLLQLQIASWGYYTLQSA